MKKKLSFIMPFIIALIFALFSSTKFYDNQENRIYDLFLRIKPPIREIPEILLVDVDDLAISKVGVWPWSRSIMADGLLTMKELGAEYAVFDIEYTEKSPGGINTSVLKDKVPETMDLQFDTINGNIKSLFEALESGSLKLKDAAEFASQLTEMNDEIKSDLMCTIDSISRDNDTYLGQCAKYFGNAFFTVNMFEGKDPSVSEDLKKWTEENIPVKNIVSTNNDFFTADDIRPAIAPILKMAKGAGFPNVIIDNDGVRRRIDLFRIYNGKFFHELAVSPMYDWLGKPEIIADKNEVLLKNAALPDGRIKDIKIPLYKGKLLINWSEKSFTKSFRHMTYWYLEMHNRLFRSLAENLKLMDEAGFLSYYSGDTPLRDIYRYSEDLLQEMLESGNSDRFEEYKEVRGFFLAETGTFLSGGAEQKIMADISAVLNSPDIPQDIKETYKEIESKTPEIFSSTKSVYEELINTRKIISDDINGAFCIIGNTGTSTTDIGVTPFEKEYMNVGTHASVVNTILTENFLNIAPNWISIFLTFVLSGIIFFMIKKAHPVKQVLYGFIFLFAVIALFAYFFRITGIYIKIVSPAGSVFTTFVIFTMINMISTSKEKVFIKNAFGHYLSHDVITQLLDNPDKLKLGGDKKELTAIFTDIRGFSTISEKLTPVDLVKLLNEYLTAMSDIILDSKGTIDKYEGDAIISFFGAPVEVPDHALNAMEAAVLMKRKENEINKMFIEKKMTPGPLLTRIGINTGDMVVGNMGTVRKMDYTIMGNAVNLAARLEGVNKQYGTWILASEYTVNETKNKFVCRKLDRVRVVGINTPVQLFEVIDIRSDASDEVLEKVDISHKALEKFLDKDWAGCKKLFEKVLEKAPQDGPALTYIKRCDQFMESPPEEGWDGVFNLTQK